MLPTGPTANPLPLWLEPGHELVDVLAGDGMSGMGDGVSVTLKKREGERYRGKEGCITESYLVWTFHIL